MSADEKLCARISHAPLNPMGASSTAVVPFLNESGPYSIHVGFLENNKLVVSETFRLEIKLAWNVCEWSKYEVCPQPDCICCWELCCIVVVSGTSIALLW